MVIRVLIKNVCFYIVDFHMYTYVGTEEDFNSNSEFNFVQNSTYLTRTYDQICVVIAKKTKKCFTSKYCTYVLLCIE